MIQTDIDISTKVRYAAQTGVVIYNRCRQGNEMVVVEFDNKSFPIDVLNVNALEVKYGGEEWTKVSELGKRK